MTPDNLKDQLERDEGLRLFPYEDTVGKTTIGVGRNLDDRGITREEAEILLQHDIAKVEREVEDALPWIRRLDEVRKAVLLNMGFNLGVEGLLSFSQMLEAVKEGRWSDAAHEMEDSLWWDQVGPRAERLQQQMVEGEWQ